MPPPTDPTLTLPPEGPTPPPPPVAPAPVEVAGFILGEELGRGAMGVVYVAHQCGLNRTVALKMMSGAARAECRHLIRFLAEAEAAAAVRHPNVVQVYQFGESGGAPYMAMELCAGGTLAKALASGRLAPAVAAEVCEKVARGVAAAHDRGIIHRDLKPSNVLFGDGGEPKVTDFGLAKWGRGGDLTATNAVLGTPSYMSPEQAKADLKLIGPTSDIWSVGAILYECLTGRKAFTGPEPYSILRRVVEMAPDRPRAAARDVPRDLELIALKCLRKEPRDRYPTALALAADLRAWREGRPVSARPLTPPQRAWRRAKRSPVAAASLAAALFATTAGAAVGLWQASVAESHAASARAAAARAEAHAKERDAALRESEAARHDTDVARLEAKGELERSRAVTDFLLKDLLGQAGSRAQIDADFAPDPGLTVRAAVDRAAAGVGERFAERPLTEAAVRRVIGRSFAEVGDPHKAVPHLERAAELYSHHLGAASPETVWTLVYLAWAYSHSGRDADAAQLLESRRAAALANQPADSRAARAFVGTLATALSKTGRAAEAVAMLEGIAPAPGSPADAEACVWLHNLGVAYGRAGRRPDAARAYERARAGYLATLGPDHPQPILTAGNLAATYRALGRLTEAVTLLDDTVPRALAVLGSKHPRAEASARSRAKLLAEAGRRDDAAAARRQLLDIDHARYRPGSAALADALELDATGLLDLERPVDAVAPLREALAARERLSGVPAWKVASARSLLGAALADAGGADAEAERLLRSACEALPAPGAPAGLEEEVRRRLAEFLAERGRK